MVLHNNLALATHAAGAELLYKKVGNKTYEFTYYFYRACESGSINARGSYTMKVFSNSCPYNAEIVLPKVSEDGDITPLCSSKESMCDGGTEVGYERFTYRKTVTFPNNCSDYRFSVCEYNRNLGIGTLVNPDTMLCVETTMNSYVPNESVQFSNPPVNIICANQTYCSNFGIYDPDGDSLAFSLVTPLKNWQASLTGGVQTDTCAYLPGYSTSMPLQGASISLDPLSGNFCISPTATEIGVIALKIEEYRNGNVISTVIRDIQIAVLPCMGNQEPDISDIHGSFTGGIFDTTICVGQELEIDVLTQDPDGDPLEISSISAFSGADVQVIPGSSPILECKYTPLSADAGSTRQITFTVKDDGCPYYAQTTQTINIHILDSVHPNINGAFEYCQGEETAVQFTSNITGTWSGIGVSTSGLFSPSGLTPGSYPISFQGHQQCAGETVKIVEIHENPDYNLAPIDTICDGQTISLEMTSTHPLYGVYWMFDDSVVAYGTSTNYDASSSGWIYSLANNIHWCRKRDSVWVEVNEPITMGGSFYSLCQLDSSFYLDESISAEGIWSGPFTSDSGLFEPSTPGIYNIEFIPSDTFCFLSNPYEVNVLALPNFEIEVDSGFCEGFEIQTELLYAGLETYSQYTWGPGEVFSDSTSLSTSLVLDEPGLIYLEVVDSVGCKNTDSSNVLIHPAPEVDIASVTNPHCALSPTGSAMAITSWDSTYTIEWSTGETSLLAESLTAGTYSVSVSNEFGCFNSDSIDLMSDESLDVDVSTIMDSCGTSEGVISLSAYGGSAPYTYEWDSLAINTNYADGLHQGVYSILVKDAFGCETETFVELEGNQPLSNLAEVIPDTCGEGLGSIFIHTNGGTSPYFYYNDENDSTLTNLEYGMYISEIIDAFRCVLRDTFYVENISLGQADFEIERVDNTLEFTNLSSGILTVFQWEFGDGGYSDEVNPVYTYTYDGLFDIILYAYSRDSTCADTSTIPVAVETASSLTPYNILTPNGDGINDVFRIQYEGIEQYNCTIFNRWGIEMYSFTEREEGWDGKTYSGEKASPGTYFFFIDGQGKDNMKYFVKSHLTLFQD